MHSIVMFELHLSAMPSPKVVVADHVHGGSDVDGVEQRAVARWEANRSGC
jgi:hypothetical protein